MSFEWYIGDIRADSLVGRQVPTFSRGREESLEFLFTRSDDDSETMVLGGEDGTAFGATLSGDDTTALARHRKLKEHIEYIGSYPNDRTLGGEVFIREFLTSKANVKSNIVRLKPGDNIQFPALWIAITGGEDLTELPGDLSMEIEIIMLAKAQEYNSKDELLADLNTPVVQ